MAQDYKLELDEPWTFLNARGNPIQGRRLTFELGDGTVVTIDVSMAEYRKPDVVKAKLQEQIEAHEALQAL